MTGTVVVDTTCLVVLERIGCIDILKRIFPEVCVPTAVQQELGSIPEWLTVVPIHNAGLVSSLGTQLGKGEAEAIALAVELGNSLIVSDDKKARRIARQMGLSVMGTLAVLVRAKQAGAVGQVKPLLDAMKHAGFHMTDTLYQETLRLAGE